VKTLQERLSAQGPPKVRPQKKCDKKPQNSLNLAVSEWNRAISETDVHARRCRVCARRRHPEALAKATGTLVSIDPFRPCREAVRLHAAEVAARLAYQAVGGTFPVKRRNYGKDRRAAY
jgi:hypothetical protein